MGRRAARVALALVLLGTGAGARAAIEAAVREAIGVLHPPQAASIQAVRQSWAARGFAPVFVEAEPPFRATPRARDVVAAMSAAADRGLDARAYQVARWLDALDAPRDEAQAARLEAGLAHAWAGLLADVGFGRVDPRALGYDLPAQRRRDRLGPALRAALEAPTAAAALEAIEPTLPPYRRLVAELARWRALAALPPPPPLPAVRGKVAPGDLWPGVDALRERLWRTGEAALPQAPPPAGSDARYEGALVDAVRRFQARHGLDADGVIGARTLEALAVPAARRVRQIELSLERMRWLGTTPQGRYVAVNIPEYRLWAVDGGQVVTTMAVVVGRPVTATPVFVDEIEAVEFNPYWNVPRSIASKELYPKLAREAGWLASQHMELIGQADGDLRRALAAGTARLRQRPGPDNALGRVRFVMPNAHDVYLHDTPARGLFAAARRDFSHGCIRLERPLDLVAFAMQARPDWNAARAEAAIASGRNRTEPIGAGPIPVLIFYATAVVGEDGRARFVPDVYGLDARLDAALSALNRPR